MSTFEIIMAVSGIVVVPVIGYLFSQINQLKEKLHDLEMKSIAGDELTKKHILNCVNYKPRHNLDK